MKYHYLHETIRYSTIGEIDDIASYDIEWKFDDGEVLTGAVVEKIWYRLGDHSIQLTVTNRENGYSIKETLNVSIILRSGVNTDVMHTVVNKISIDFLSKFYKIHSHIYPVDTTVNEYMQIVVIL